MSPGGGGPARTHAPSRISGDIYAGKSQPREECRGQCRCAERARTANTHLHVDAFENLTLIADILATIPAAVGLEVSEFRTAHIVWYFRYRFVFQWFYIWI